MRVRLLALVLGAALVTASGIGIGGFGIGAASASAVSPLSGTPKSVDLAQAQVALFFTQPADTTAALRDLKATITFTAHAGDKHVVSSELRVKNASPLTALTQVVACRNYGAPHLLTNAIQIVERGHNVLPSPAITRQDIRFVFTAPADGTYDCSLGAVWINHTDTKNHGVISVVTGSYIRDAGLVPWAVQTVSPSPQLLQVSHYVDILVMANQAVPASITRINVVGDFVVTGCSTAYVRCPAEGARDNAYAASQLVVQQLNADGKVCKTTSDGPFNVTVVSPQIHHQEIYHSLNSLVLDPTCTGHAVTAYVRVVAQPARAPLKANDFEIEAAPETLGYID